MSKREDHEVQKDMWWHWTKKKLPSVSRSRLLETSSGDSPSRGNSDTQNIYRPNLHKAVLNLIAKYPKALSVRKFFRKNILTIFSSVGRLVKATWCTSQTFIILCFTPDGSSTISSVNYELKTNFRRPAVSPSVRSMMVQSKSLNVGCLSIIDAAGGSRTI